MTIGHSFAKGRCLFLPFILLVLTSCVSNTGNTQPDKGQKPESTEAAAGPTKTLEIFTPQPISTSTLPILTGTPTPNVPQTSPSFSPTPTLTNEVKAQNLTMLMRTNGGCDLPCWWGIVPDKSQVESVKNDLVAIGASWLGDNYTSIGVDWGLSIEFEVNGGIIQTVSIGSSFTPGVIDRESYTQGWQRYSLAEMLNRYGQPTQVLVYSPFRADPGDGSGYHLLVFYENLGIEIEYRGTAEHLSDGQYRACPDLVDIWEISLFLYQPNQEDNVVERVLPLESISYITGPETAYELISWQQATGTNLEFFYETFREAGSDVCFEFSTN